jgi:hypothetical protein
VTFGEHNAPAGEDFRFFAPARLRKWSSPSSRCLGMPMRIGIEWGGAALRRRLLCRRPEALAGFFSLLHTGAI